MVDSDGDSFWDGEEVNANTDPTDPTSFPEKSQN
ncbi:thrombospondin type 3 repeat-containing protein [Kaarinaea lacus]